MITVLTTLAILAMVGFFVWVIIEGTSSNDVYKDNIKVYNYGSQYTNGYHEGYLTEQKRGPKRSIIKFVPTDVNFEKPKKVEEQRFVVDNNKIDRISKSGLSENCTIMYLFPPKSEDLPEDFKKSNMGKVIMNLIEEKNNENETINILRKKDKNRLRVLERDEGDDIVGEWLEREKHLGKDVIDKYLQFKDKNNSSSQILPSSNENK